MEFSTPSAPAVVRGREGFREIAERYLRALPDFRIVNRPLAYTDEQVVVLWRVTGTHLGPLLVELALTNRRSARVELPASGRRVDVPGCSVIRAAKVRRSGVTRGEPDRVIRARVAGADGRSVATACRSRQRAARLQQTLLLRWRAARG